MAKNTPPLSNDDSARIDALLDSLNQARDKTKELHDLLWALAEQNGGEVRFKPPVERRGYINVYLDNATNEVVISSKQ